MQVHWDTIEGSEIELASSEVKIVRTGYVTDIPADVSADPFVLTRALEGILGQLPQHHPALPQTTISRLLIRPSRGTDQVTFEVEYLMPTLAPAGNAIARWYVEDISTLTNETEEMDFNGNPVQVYFSAGGGAYFNENQQKGLPENPANPDSGAGPPAIHTAQLPVLRPRRVLSIHGWIIGKPGIETLIAHGGVNDRAWQGRPRGYWLCTEASSRIEHRGGNPFDPNVRYYKVGARFMTKVFRDWSHYAFHRNLAGKIPADLSRTELVNARQALIRSPYEPGQTRINGFTRSGQYDVANFEQIFGF